MKETKIIRTYGDGTFGIGESVTEDGRAVFFADGNYDLTRDQMLRKLGKADILEMT